MPRFVAGYARAVVDDAAAVCKDPDVTIVAECSQGLLFATQHDAIAIAAVKHN